MQGQCNAANTRTSEVFSQIGTLRVVCLPQPQVLHPLHSRTTHVCQPGCMALQRQPCTPLYPLHHKRMPDLHLLSAHAPVCL